MDHGKVLSTYYLYDFNDDLTCIIPPKLVPSLASINYQIDESSDAFKAFAYRYKYDNKRRCIYKKLPGCEPIYYIYDKMGNCIFTQDGEMRQRGEWKYTIPDKFGRMALAADGRYLYTATYYDYRGNAIQNVATNICFYAHPPTFRLCFCK